MDIIVSVCIKEEDKVLMVQEAGKRIYGLWNFPGGHLDFNEDIFMGAIREAKEETGYDVEILSILSIHNYLNKDKPVLLISFNGKINAGEVNFDPKEILQVKWFSFEELDKMDDKELRGPDSKRDLINDLKDNKQYPLSVIKNIVQE